MGLTIEPSITMDVYSAFVVIVFSAQSLSASKSPQNVAVDVGQSVIFHCRTESNASIWWKFKSTSTTASEIFIFKDTIVPAEFGRCHINASAEGQYDLHINNTRLSDAGTYTCTEFAEAATIKHFSELVVFAESIPECDTNLTDSSTSVLEENDSLWMWCSVEFRGNLNPVMEWMNGSNGEITHSKATLISNKLLVSEIVVQVKNSEKDVFLSCTTRFDLTSVRNIMKNFSDRVNTMATNIPDYRLPWISPPITISRVPKPNAAVLSSIQTTASATGPLEVDRSSSTTASVNASSVVMAIVSIVALILLCVTIFCCTAVKKPNKELTEFSGLGPISSQDAGNVRTTDAAVTFRQNDAEPFYEEITSQDNNGGRTAAIAVSVFYEDPIQSTDGRAEDRGLTTASGAASGAEAISQTVTRQVNDHVYSTEPIQGVTSNEAPRTSVSPCTSTNSPQSTYVGVWMEGSDGARDNSSSEGAATAASTYDYVDAAHLLRDIRSQEKAPRLHANSVRPTQKVHVGVDGTIYVEVGTASRSQMSSTSQQQSLFNKSIYASIDHTAQNISQQPANNFITRTMDSFD